MVKLRPNDPYALVIRGFARLKAGQLDGAIADYNAALKQDAKNPSALYGRGTAELKKHNPRGNADVAAAKAIKADIAEEFARYGVKSEGANK
jgi:Flp pilus assembly protein TadD